MLAFPAALAAHGVSAVASTQGNHRAEHHGADRDENKTERDDREHVSPNRKRDKESREHEGRPDDGNDLAKRPAMVTAVRIKGSPPPLFAPPLPVADGAFPVAPAPPLTLAVAAALIIAAGLGAVLVLTARLLV